MNNKAAKKLKRLAVTFAVMNGQTLEQSKVIYKRLKEVHKENKKTPN